VSSTKDEPYVFNEPVRNQPIINTVYYPILHRLFLSLHRCSLAMCVGNVATNVAHSIQNSSLRIQKV